LVSDAPPDVDEPQRGDVVLLADSSVEGEDIATSLRTRGFVVFDVPIGLLEARVASEKPRVVVLDVDQPGALDRARRLKEGAYADVEVLCVGDPLRAAELSDVSLFDNVFERPVDVPRLVERVMSLATPSGPGFANRGTTPPPMYAQRPSAPPAPDSVPPISEIPRGGGALEASGLLDDSAEPAAALGLVAGTVRLSPELEQRIAAAEERVRETIDGTASAPEEEADAPVDPALLALLDEPIDALDEAIGTGSSFDLGGSSGGSSSGTGSGSALTPAPRPLTNSGTGVGVASGTGTGTGGGTQAPLTGVGDAQPSSALGAPSDPLSGSSPKAASPALGIRLGELLGIRPPTDRGPAVAEALATPTPPRGIPRLPTPTQAHGFDPVLLRQLQQVVTEAIGTANVSNGPDSLEASTRRNDDDSASMRPTVSPPVRFQEPRDIASGRAVIDLGPSKDPRDDPSGSAYGGQGRGGNDRSGPGSGRVSPAAQSVPSAKVASRGPESAGTATATQLGAFSMLLPSRSETSSALPAVFGEAEGQRPIAHAIATRMSGAVALSSGGGVRRIILHEGDVVTAASEIADESLVSYLASKGDLDRDAAARLAGKLPPSGRHAGAALIAQGFLAQNDLWPVLRGHAEWLIGRAMTSGPGTIDFEDEPPGRLRAEPSVFGGAAGAEIFVETARRVLSPDVSLASLGGPEARLAPGGRGTLLGECALSEEEAAAVKSAAGRTLREITAGLDPEFASVLRALVDLDVVALITPARRDTATRRDEADPLDEEAIRQRVRARMALVRDGDYFSLLGVGKDATAYEIKRAYLDLRRMFEPTRLLTAATADLHDDVTLIVEVVDEAYDILRDGHRRERYRRAIEAGPPG
jgi:hypothetical protein